MFSAQFFAVTWLSLVQIATYNFLRGNIKGICTAEQAEGLTCPGAKTFYNASVIWGLVGPKKMFCESPSPSRRVCSSGSWKKVQVFGVRRKRDITEHLPGAYLV